MRIRGKKFCGNIKRQKERKSKGGNWGENLVIKILKGRVRDFEGYKPTI